MSLASLKKQLKKVGVSASVWDGKLVTGAPSEQEVAKKMAEKGYQFRLTPVNSWDGGPGGHNAPLYVKNRGMAMSLKKEYAADGIKLKLDTNPEYNWRKHESSSL